MLKKTISVWFLVLGLIGALASPLEAVTTTSGGIATSLGGTTGWDYVGSVNGASGVYLGDFDGSYWVISAAHVSAGTFTLGGYTYSYVADTSTQLTTGSSGVDVILYQISGDTEALAYLDSLTNLTISSTPLMNGTDVTLVGNGGGKSSGTNFIAGHITDLTTLSGYAYAGKGIYTLDANGVGVTGGDSGGGVFITGSSVLAGIMSAQGSSDDVPIAMIAVDLSAYYGQIMGILTASTIPEPSVFTLLAGGVGFFITLTRRRRI